MKIKPVTQKIGIALYTLPFLFAIVFSFTFTWVGDWEMVVIGVALLPAVLYFCGVRWCRFVVGGFATLLFVAASVRAIPAFTANHGRYFWVILLPLWLLFGFSAVVAFVPVQSKPRSGPLNK